MWGVQKWFKKRDVVFGRCLSSLFDVKLLRFFMQKYYSILVMIPEQKSLEIEIKSRSVKTHALQSDVKIFNQGHGNFLFVARCV